MKKIILFLIFSSFFSFAQKTERAAWIEVDKSKVSPFEKNRLVSIPTDYRLYEFDYVKFKNQLVNVPLRENYTGISNVVISFPMPSGALEQFRVLEAPVFESDLQQLFPDIRSFVGQGIDDPSAIIRFSLSPQKGVSATIRSGNAESTYIIDPYSMDYKTVIVFDRKHVGKRQSFTCSTEEDLDAVNFGPSNRAAEYDNEVLNNADDGVLRRFRAAISCTGEYAAYHGGTLAGVNAAYNATMTRVNALYEMDFNATMVIIATNNNVIYLNAATDPYGNTDANYNAEVQAVMNAQIGAANYDVGHLFSAIGNNGNAGCIGCVCGTGSSTAKGSAFTTSTIPEGESFDVDYTAHEYGHQFGGRHTFSHSTENSTVNVEPGSGVTIMGYAGITGATDVASNSIAIFHASSIEQITNNIKGKTCPVEITTGNNIPVPSVFAITKTLPRGTAFKLTGTATDADGDILSYCWEQVDDAGTTQLGNPGSFPSETKTAGPNFRSWLPKNNGTRYFPRLEDHVANGIAGNQWEIVPNNPAANRTLNFRMTVRDNRFGAGTNESVNVAVTFDRLIGPFLVTSQNTSGISYTQGSTQTITWSVNNTTSLAGSANVNIKLSTDGGKTFPITLAANTPNDGAQDVIIPNVSAPFCRILIEPTGNDYYAINTNDFAIGFTVSDICNTYTSSGINATIVEQSPLAYQTFSLNVPDNVIISDVNVSTNINHRVNQLYVGINHPDLSFVQLFRQDDYGCGNNVSPLTCTFDDSGIAYVCGGAGTYTPSSSLAAFNGKSSLGTWRFRVADVTSVGGPSNSGILNSFSIQICYKQIEESPNACGVITSTWNGSTWSNGVPLKNVVAIFDGNYSSTADLEACSVIINSGANVTFNAGHTLIVTNEVTVNGTGTLTIENDAALRQIDGSGINTGNITVRRNSTPMVRLDYTAWGSPVVGQNIKNFSPNTLDNRFYEYLFTGTTTPTAYLAVANVTSTNFASGKGYMIRSANNWPTTPTIFNGQYFGVPFNGDLSVDLGRGYNLLSNPYASPIDANRFMFDNENLVGALYFWTHATPASGGVYPINNYASYTLLGGVASAGGGPVPNGTIQTGQGFFVRSFDFGTASFSNLQRVNASASSQFYRTSNYEVSINNADEKHRIWLNLNDAENAYNQIMLGYLNGATIAFDHMIDGRVLDDSKPMIYSLVNDEKLVIQGRGLPFTDEDTIPLGLKIVATGTYSISIETFDGLFESQDIFLKDNSLNTIHDLKQSAYTFTSSEGIFENRFEIVFKNSTLSNEDILNENTLTIYTNSNGIVVNSNEMIKELILFDVLGRKLQHKTEVNDFEFVVDEIIKSNQALFIKTVFSNGITKTKKVIY
jgi:hypothetical protein